ncbi:16S rRNA (guanine(966)-N(2))-methyltransferase RsmD [Hasllibacter sp. MH4015]|uniref:16S rRNA (guanine(966)-N(2))-methyltransferase RsmD n=1 Tax=Hasllibacter sp. MH4015 TaxID=2854029 RepID=UPI001CD7B87D|nr:16S rRNA (guanine(966)-N(2))-methyltransferase RsmD [Hasllibacter sp. MH4015]
MRIVGGRWRGKKLADVGDGDAKAHLRPTTDRVRENLFNLLTNGRAGDLVTGTRVLDVFAGTGALGLEALSRGAVQATFVDNGRAARTLLRENIALCAAQGLTKVFRKDVHQIGPARDACDLIFLDPPYGKSLGESALTVLSDNGWIAPGATVAWEEAHAPIVPAPFQVLDQRSYGQTTLTILRHP